MFFQQNGEQGKRKEKKREDKGETKEKDDYSSH